MSLTPSPFATTLCVGAPPQNVERIIALGAPSAAELEELYATGQLSRHEVETRTIAERKKQAEKVRICSSSSNNNNVSLCERLCRVNSLTNC